LIRVLPHAAHGNSKLKPLIFSTKACLAEAPLKNHLNPIPNTQSARFLYFCTQFPKSHQAQLHV
ncbi:MAG: hypothetical protein ACE362_12025, partial [Phaeodactylibacter xiamenensis]|uniref:hypothetical protein n=1 Tax=Phaeodactylibacter xiamenensis TaxID=1524460 RepID=UPI003918BB77